MQKLIGFTVLLMLKLSLFSTELKSELDYVKNIGQWETPVLFKADLKGGWVFLEKNAVTYSFIENKHNHANHKEHKPDEIIKGHVYKTKWLNANELVQITESEKQAYYNNYFIGNDQNKWQSNVGNYRIINYSELYRHIDAKIYSEAHSMKTDYIIHPSGHPSDIKIQYDGVDGISIEPNGQLKITTSINAVFELKPYTYQMINGNKIEINCKYKLSNNILSFDLPDGYNKDYDLIIDPTLIFSTYSGSPTDNWGSSATHDNSGNMFLGGISLGSGYPNTTGAFQTTFGGGSGSLSTDVVITKFNANGTGRLYSTYLGGNSNELLQSLYCTPQNELVVLLTTSSSNFPTSTNAYDKSFNGGVSDVAVEISFPNGADEAIVKLNANGTNIIGSTFFGGNGNDGLNATANLLYNYGDDSRGDIAIDNNGNILITSATTSNNLPGTSGKAQPSYAGNSDGFVASFNSNLSLLNWATYFGGSGEDASYSIQLDASKNIFICGGTTSSSIPASNSGLNTTYRGGISDGFVAKLNSTGSSYLVSSYIGTSNYDQAYIMDLDDANNVYLFGQTNGSYPVSANVYSNAGANQFIHKLNNNLNTTSFSTVFGSTNSSNINISPTAFLVDICGNMYATGWGGDVNTRNGSPNGNTFNMPVTNDGYKRTTDGSDFYLINLSANATNLIYATYFGENGGVGDHVDGGTSRFDKNGIVYQAVCASCGGTNSFPTTSGAWSRNNNSSNCNMAGIKFRFDLIAMQITSITANPPSGCAPLNVSFSYTSTQPGTSFFWDFGDGQTSTTEFPTHTYSTPGTYTCKFIIRNPTNCNTIDSATVTVTVLNPKTSQISRSICQGGSTVFNGQTLTQAGTYRDTFRTNLGCDSFVVLTLSVNPTKTSTISISICQGKSTVFNGQTITQAGSYRDTLLQVNGCDSFIVLTVSVIPPKTSEITRRICQGRSTVFNGQTITQAGIYRDTLLQSSGCDSFIVLTVIVDPIKNSTISRTICAGQSTVFNGQTITVAGTYRDTLSSSLGCDSFVVLTVIVNPVKTTPISRVICQGQSVVVGNHTYSQSGNYRDTLRTSLGCDSIILLNLTVNQFVITELDRAICTGSSVIVGTHTYNQSGNYSDTLKNAQQCDSIVLLKLLVTDTLKQTINRTICEGDTAFVAGLIFTVQGTYLINLTAQDGCDSLLTLQLKVNNIQRSTIDKSICEGESFTIATQTFNETGTYTVTLTSSLQCDSIITLNLIVNQKSTNQISKVICQGESFSVGSHTYTTSGNYIDTLDNSLNCDSIVFLDLTVLPNAITNLNPSICQGSSFTVGDSVFTTTGNYVVKLDAANGCDSIINVRLTVHPNKTTNLIESICEGQVFTIGTQVFDTTGNYSVNLNTSNGCDSIVNLDLTLYFNKSTFIEKAICRGERITVGNNTYTQAGNYIDTLQTSKGCDSIVHLQLTVNPTPTIEAVVDTNLVKKGTQVQLNVITNDSLQYNWMPNTVSQVDIKNPTAIVNVPMWYVVTATFPQTNCKTVDSVLVDILQLPCTNEYIYIPNAFSPNNDGVNDYFRVRSLNLTEGTLVVFDRWGNKVFESNDFSKGWDGIYKGQPAQEEVYGYYFVGKCELGESIKIKGNVTLLR